MEDGLGRSEGDDPLLHNTGTASVGCGVGVQWRTDDIDPFAWPHGLESRWWVRCQKEFFPRWRPRIDVVRRVGPPAENFPVPRHPRRSTSAVGVWGLTRDGMQRGVQFHSSRWMPPACGN